MGWIVLLLIIGLVLVFVSTYNRLVMARNAFKNAFAQIDVQLTRRYDLIPNLVEIAKGYIKHERETLEAVIRARNTAYAGLKTAASDPGNAAAVQQLSGADQQLGGALGRLMAVAESYPDLKANQNMMQLSEELTSTENKVAFARQAYNDAVMSYNNAREVFPSSIVAGMFNFQPAQPLDIAKPETREAPKVSFTCRRDRAVRQMDFYARQVAARGQTRWLVIGFILSLLAVSLALDLVLFTFLSSAQADRTVVAPLQFAALNPGVALFSTLLVMGVLGLASLYKSMELRGGGGVVARSLGGGLVAQDTTDLQRKRLLNVVSEMAIASGVPMPEVYVLEQEAAINAFAAGHSPANAAVTVTQGALDRLNRDQLQGVIGHEFSHILNGDMRLNVQLMGWVFGLFVVALIGRLVLNFSPRSRRGNNGIVALGFAVMVLGYVGLFFGRLLQAAVSRQRERLADASGVQFTRNPQGLKEALVKIAAAPDGSVLTTPHAEQAAHMFFAEGLNRFFATHPPILERIRELDPQFDERELARVAAEYERTGVDDGAGADASQGRGAVGGAGLGSAGTAAGADAGDADV